MNKKYLAIVSLSLMLGMFSGLSHAICIVTLPFIPAPGGPAYGSEATVTTSCFTPIAGGGGVTTSSMTNTFSIGSGSATSNLSTGLLTAYATTTSSSGNNIWSASNFWDTLTFSGLPTGGTMLTAMFTLTGSFTGSGVGSGFINVNGASAASFSASSSSPLPSSISASFLVLNGTPIQIGAGLLTVAGDFNTGALGTANLNPATFSILAPSGATFTSASTKFVNVTTVPLPASLGLLSLGLAAITGVARRGKSRVSHQTGSV